jgi:hypothetical protein
MNSPREFFESLESRIDPARAAGMNASYKFDIDGAGSWNVDVDDGKVTVTENGGEADTTITTLGGDVHEDRQRRADPTAAYIPGS